MGFIFNREKPTQTRAVVNTGYPGNGHDFWYSQIANQVSEGLATAYACKLAITESVSMLPAITLIEEEDGKKAPDKENYLYSLIKDQPNSYMGSFDFFESQQNSLLDHGNSYSFLGRNKLKEIREIRPLDAARMVVKPLGSGKIGYLYRDEDGKERRYTQEDILHVRYNSLDGINGRSPSDVCRTAFQYARFLESHGKNIFEKGGFLAGFLQLPEGHKFGSDAGSTAEEKKLSFVQSFKKGLFGTKNLGAIGLLEGGVTYQPYQGNNKDNQFLELSDFSVNNIARIYRVPPQMLGVVGSGDSYASVEHRAVMWVQYTIQPWVTRWERAFQWQLFGKESPSYLKFNLKALLRGDLKSEMEALVLQVESGLKTINEARETADLNPSSDPLADKLLVSHNLLQGILNEQQQTNPN